MQNIERTFGGTDLLTDVTDFDHFKCPLLAKLHTLQAVFKTIIEILYAAFYNHHFDSASMLPGYVTRCQHLWINAIGFR